jgi:hypothetical protein
MLRGNWQQFYAPIQGFEYVPGYIYKLKVKETQPPAHQVPADKSSIAYELVEVLDKQADSRLRLGKVEGYLLEGLKLHLQNAGGKTLLSFQKTD